MSNMVRCSMLLGGVLTACSYNVVQEHYYALNPPSLLQSLAQTTAKAAQPLLLVEPVSVAEFLATGAIVMQVNAHQLQLSNHHRWAENLQQALTFNVQAKLAARLAHYQVESSTRYWQQQTHSRLQINVSDFHISARHSTICAGQFWLFDSEQKLLSKQAFYIELALTKDGYVHAVHQLNNALDQLAEQIIEKLPHMAN
jgi:uncharacterized protein